MSISVMTTALSLLKVCARFPCRDFLHVCSVSRVHGLTAVESYETGLRGLFTHEIHVPPMCKSASSSQVP